MTVMLTGVFVCHSSVCNKLYAKEQHWLERSAPKWSQFTISEASDMFQQGVNPAVGWYVAAPDPSLRMGSESRLPVRFTTPRVAAKLASTQSSWMGRIPRPLPPID